MSKASNWLLQISSVLFYGGIVSAQQAEKASLPSAEDVFTLSECVGREWILWDYVAVFLFICSAATIVAAIKLLEPESNRVQNNLLDANLL